MAIITPNLSRQFIRKVRLPAAPRRARAVTGAPPPRLEATDAQPLVRLDPEWRRNGWKGGRDAAGSFV